LFGIDLWIWAPYMHKIFFTNFPSNILVHLRSRKIW
jgi:hypothetical protein